MYNEYDNIDRDRLDSSVASDACHADLDAPCVFVYSIDRRRQSRTTWAQIHANEIFTQNEHKRPDYPCVFTPKWHKVRFTHTNYRAEMPWELKVRTGTHGLRPQFRNGRAKGDCRPAPSRPAQALCVSVCPPLSTPSDVSTQTTNNDVSTPSDVSNPSDACRC